MFNRVWHLIYHVTNPVMQIEPFVLFDMERWAMKWKISPEMRHRGRVPFAPDYINRNKLLFSDGVSCWNRTHSIIIAFSRRNQKSSLSRRIRLIFPKGLSDNWPPTACSLKLQQAATPDVNNSKVLSGLGDKGNFLCSSVLIKSCYSSLNGNVKIQPD